MEDIGWEEYAVFAAVLLSSTAIGVYYGCFGSRQKSTKEYLLADRNMSSIPVALSLICSTVSAITLMSYPGEIYQFGTQYFLVVLCYIPLSLSLAYLYIPVYFNLNVSSAYEYIEIRFNSGLRMLVSVFAVLHMIEIRHNLQRLNIVLKVITNLQCLIQITSMSIAVYAPSLAIELVTGINTRISTAVICFVCIFYSTLGGLKAVLWTDVLQAIVMLLSLAVIAGKGVSDLGGFGVMWDRVESTGRVEFLNFDPDPRTRHTVWTCLIAGYFFWLPTYASTQLQIQRFLSMPTISRARRAIFMNFFGMQLIVGLCFFTGMVILAKYYQCDPIKSKQIEKTDQLVPYFVKNTVQNVPGLLGLFVSGLTCASMSSLSSGLTALSSITTYDYINKFFPKLSDSKLSFISKVNTFCLGIVTYLFIFVVETMGSILPATTALSGLLIGPTLGLFTLGMFFPPTTSKAGLMAMVTTISIMAPYTILQNIYTSDLPDQKLPLSIEGCSTFNVFDVKLENKTLHPSSSDWKDVDDNIGIKLLSMSYMWYSGLTCSLTVLFGIIFSLFHRTTVNPNGKEKLVPTKCISPPLLILWKRFFPCMMDKIMEKDSIMVEMNNN